MAPLIRRGVQVDAPVLKGLDAIVALGRARAECTDHWLCDSPVLVAEVEGPAVGYGVFDLGLFGQSNVAMLMIHEDYRGQKIGERILLMLEEFGDMPKFFVATSQSSHRMQRHLSRTGNRPGGCIHGLDPHDSQIVFVKDIGGGKNVYRAGVRTHGTVL